MRISDWSSDVCSSDLWLLRTTLTDEFDELAQMVTAMPVSSATFLTILLPMLLFQGAITIDVRRLAQDFVAVVLLAVLAVLVALVVIGGAVYLVAPVPLVVCLLFGAIVATTDPRERKRTRLNSSH